MPIPSLLAPTDRDALLQRLRGLSPSAKAQWGKMDAPQMLAHLNVAFHAALGDATYQRGLLGYLFGGLAKGGALGEKPFGKGLPTDKSYKIRDQRDFAKEQAELVSAGRGADRARSP
jgi:hypothetical protein